MWDDWGVAMHKAQIMSFGNRKSTQDKSKRRVYIFCMLDTHALNTQNMSIDATADVKAKCISINKEYKGDIRDENDGPKRTVCDVPDEFHSESLLYYFFLLL